MTAQVNTATARSPVASVLAALRKIGSFMSEHSDAMRCRREAERLFAMSDAQLAAMGLTRDRIIHHAFARYLAS